MSNGRDKRPVEEDDDGDDKQSVREQDRFLPIANISRIMKKALPPNAKIAKDAKETVQECVSEFISFITSECAPTPFTRSPAQPLLPCPRPVPTPPSAVCALQGRCAARVPASG